MCYFIHMSHFNLIRAIWNRGSDQRDPVRKTVILVAWETQKNLRGEKKRTKFKTTKTKKNIEKQKSKTTTLIIDQSQFPWTRCRDLHIHFEGKDLQAKYGITTSFKSSLLHLPGIFPGNTGTSISSPIPTYQPLLTTTRWWLAHHRCLGQSGRFVGALFSRFSQTAFDPLPPREAWSWSWLYIYFFQTFCDQN